MLKKINPNIEDYKEIKDAINNDNLFNSILDAVSNIESIQNKIKSQASYMMEQAENILDQVESRIGSLDVNKGCSFDLAEKIERLEEAEKSLKILINLIPQEDNQEKVRKYFLGN